MIRACVCFSLLCIASPVSAQFVSIQTPRPAATVARAFTVAGETGTAVDALHVWAFPQSGAVFLGSGSPTCPPPGANSVCSFTFVTAAFPAPVGTYSVVAYGHDPTTNTFPWQAAVTLTVEQGPLLWSGFSGSTSINPVDLDEAFTIMNGGGSGVIRFGHDWPSPPTCVGQMENATVYIATTRTHATLTITGGSLVPIRVMCGGGR